MDVFENNLLRTEPYFNWATHGPSSIVRADHRLELFQERRSLRGGPGEAPVLAPHPLERCALLGGDTRL